MVETLEKSILSLLQQRNQFLDLLQTQNDFEIKYYKTLIVLSSEKELILKEIVANHYVNILIIANKRRQAEKVSESECYLDYQINIDSPGRTDIYGEIISNLESMNQSLQAKCEDLSLMIN